jgi:hypothetical protein
MLLKKAMMEVGKMIKCQEVEHIHLEVNKNDVVFIGYKYFDKMVAFM